jgi:hypothetical protein
MLSVCLLACAITILLPGLNVDGLPVDCSGAEDVALIEYARLTGRPFRVFSLDTGRLNAETYRYFAQVGPPLQEPKQGLCR